MNMVEYSLYGNRRHFFLDYLPKALAAKSLQRKAYPWFEMSSVFFNRNCMSINLFCVQLYTF